MTKAVGYLRVSSEGQIDGDGFKRQCESIEKFCATKGWKLTAVFVEWGISGDNDLAARPSLAAMLEHTSNGSDTKIAVVENAGRWSRDAVLAEIMLREFREAGVQVFSADNAVDLTDNKDPAATFIRHIFAAFYQFEKATLVLKLRAARERKKKTTNGKEGKEGPKRYGSLPGEEETYNLIYECVLRGMSDTKIGTMLNSRGLYKRSGGRWTRNSIYAVTSKIRAENIVTERRTLDLITCGAD